MRDAVDWFLFQDYPWSPVGICGAITIGFWIGLYVGKRRT